MERSDEWEIQYWNLNEMTHNQLRISRILKCLGEFGLEKYKRPLIEHIAREIWLNQQLGQLRTALLLYWVGVVIDDTQRSLFPLLPLQLTSRRD